MTNFEDSIAHEAHGLVYGERAKTYGHPRFDFSAIAKVWTGLLQDLLKDDVQLDPYRVAVMMTGLKLARLVKSPQHHDSRVDTIGYMLTMERLDEPEASGGVIEAEDAPWFSENPAVTMETKAEADADDKAARGITWPSSSKVIEDAVRHHEEKIREALAKSLRPQEYIVPAVTDHGGFPFTGELVDVDPVTKRKLAAGGFIGGGGGGEHAAGKGGMGASVKWRVVSRGGNGRNGDGTRPPGDGKGCPQCGQIGNAGHGGGCKNTERYDEEGNVIQEGRL